MREPCFLMPDKSLIAFSHAPNEWLREVVGGQLMYIPSEMDTPQSLEFDCYYAARLLRERGS